MEILNSPFDEFKQELDKGVDFVCRNCDARLKAKSSDFSIVSVEELNFRNEIYNKNEAVLICPVCSFENRCGRILSENTYFEEHKAIKYIEILCSNKERVN